MERQSLSPELAELPPGPQLAALLAEIDPTRLSGPDCVTVLRAHYRQLAYDQARFLAAMAETAFCTPHIHDQVSRDEAPSEFAADEIRAALAWTRRMADTQFGLAIDLTDRLPAVHAALQAGQIDLPKAKIFADWTRDLTTEQARTVCAHLLPEAPHLTTGELIHRLKQLAIAIDPAWAERKYRQAIRQRRVIGYRTPDGTANLSGLDLPADEAAAACARIDTLAKKVKRAGDTRPIDLIRADLFLRLLDGSYEGWTEDEIITHLIAHPGTPDTTAGQLTATPAPDTTTSPPEPTPTTPRTTPEATPASPTEPNPFQHDIPRTNKTAPTPPAGPPARAPAAPIPTGATPKTRKDAAGHVRGGQESAPSRTAGPAGVELRARLSTLLGMDDAPAEVAGWGPVNAGQARAIARRQSRTEWRYAVCDAGGRPVHTGLISRRPAGYPKHISTRGGMVELAIPYVLLIELTEQPSRFPEWAAPLAEIARRMAAEEHNPGSDHSSRRPAHPGSSPTTVGAQARDRRAPTASARRRVQVRDRTCLFKGCRMPATATDADHRAQWQHGGRTREDNLESLCRHDHRLKDEGGWQAASPQPGVLEWHSPLGQTYRVQPPPIITPLPNPTPRDAPEPPAPHAPAHEGPIWWEPPPDPPPPPRPPPDETPPPF